MRILLFLGMDMIPGQVSSTCSLSKIQSQLCFAYIYSASTAWQDFASTIHRNCTEFIGRKKHSTFAIEFVASLEANPYIVRSADWGDHQDHVRIFIEQICLGVAQTLAHSEQSDSGIGLQNAEGSVLIQDPGPCAKQDAKRIRPHVAIPSRHRKSTERMSVFFAHNRFMNGYSSLQHSYTSSQFWLKLNLGLCLDFFRAFPANVSSLHVLFFSLLLFLGIGFLWFLASHRAIGLPFFFAFLWVQLSSLIYLDFWQLGLYRYIYIYTYLWWGFPRLFPAWFLADLWSMLHVYFLAVRLLFHACVPFWLCPFNLAWFIWFSGPYRGFLLGTLIVVDNIILQSCTQSLHLSVGLCLRLLMFFFFQCTSSSLGAPMRGWAPYFR